MDVVKVATTVFGSKHEREMRKMLPLVHRINELEPNYMKMSDFQLRDQTRRFRERLARGASLDDLLVEAFAVVREAAVRTVGMRPYDVQLIGGIALHQGKIAEMKTGEGKTLVATMPFYLNALAGRGCHLVTVNDYLAKRDAEWMGQVYRFLGMSVGSIVHGLSDRQRQQAYRADITYGTNHEFGFDYLRDNMKDSIEQYVHRLLPEGARGPQNHLFNFAVVDEVDSVLIDEARTPLIISGPAEEAADLYLKVNEVVRALKRDVDFVVDEKAHSVNLTDQGVERVERRLRITNLYDPRNLEWLHHVNQALRAHNLYKRDVSYLVENGKVVIVDEHTGRKLPGRRWSDGLHQAVEAKEGLKPEEENQTLATVTYQNYFRMYKKLSGMTGTAETEAEEFHKIYKLDVMVIPTNVPCIRADYDDVIYKTEEGKLQAVVEEILDCRKRGQPVLVGTISVEKTEEISKRLRRAKIKHEVLNAKNHEREAYIVAQAGAKGAVTIATNMAGRGTDIILGGNPDYLAQMDADPDTDPEGYEKARAKHRKRCAKEKEEVLAAGGLHILGTERHEARRIDNQLRGRSGRQGDPGSSRFYLSLEDDLMRIFGGDRLNRIMEWARMPEDVPIEHPWVNKSIERAQRQVEGHNFDIRKNLLEYDNVMNHQRRAVYALRRQVLEGRYVPELSEAEKKSGKVGKAPTRSGKWTVDLLADKVRPWVTRLLEKAYADAARMGRNEGEETEGEEAASRALPSSETLTHLLYRYFGAKVELEDEIEDQTLCTEKATREVAASLIQQRERLLDLAYELVGKQVDTYCPPNQHFDEWDHSALEDAVYQVFDLFVDGLEWLANRKEIESAVKEIFKVSDSKVSLDRLESMVRDLSDRHMPPDLDPDEWDMKAVRKAVSSDLGIKDVHLEDLSSREAAEAELVEIVIDQNDPAKLRESIHKEVQKLASRVKQYGSGLLGADFNSWLNEQIDECCPAEDTPVSWELDALVDALRTRLNRPEDGLLHLSSSDEVVDRIYQGVERFVSLADQEDDAIIAQEAAKRFLNEHCPAWKLDTLVERLQERVGLTFDIEKEAERSKIFAQIHSQASQLLDAEQIRERILELAHEELVERLGVEIPDGAEDFLKGMTDRYLSPDQPVVDWDPEEMAKQVVMWAAGETDEQEVDLKAGRSLMAFVPVRGRHVTMERFLETIEEAVHKACPTERPASSWNLGGLADEVRKAFFVSVPGLTGELNHTTLKADCLERVTTDRHTVEQLVDEHCPADATVDEWDVAGLSEAAQHKGIDLSEALWKADHEQIRRRIHKALTEAATERAKWRHPERLPALIGDLLHRYCPTWDSASLTKELERRTKKTLPSADLESATDRDDLRSRLLSMLERVDWTGAKAEDAVDATLEQWTSQWNEPGLEHDLQHALGTKIDLSTTAKTSSPEELTKDIIQKHLVSQSEKTLTPWQEKTIEELASKHHHSTSRPTWDTDGLVDTLEEIFCERFEDVRRIDSFRELNKRVLGIALAYVAGWDKALGLERRLWVFRHLYLEEVDDQWIEHLKAMDHLREGIGLRGYGQRDPKLEYQREGFAMFEAMMQRIQENVASNVFRVRLEEEEDELPEFEHKRRQMQFLHMTAPGPGGQQPEQQQQPSRPKTVRRKVRKVGPNEECPCGSGRKYKKCHMRKDQAARRRGELPEWALAQQKQAASSSQKKKSARR